jgi:hypothetical protein
MTEAEWLACDHPAPLLIYLRGEVSEKERAESRHGLHSGAGVLLPGLSPFIGPSRFVRFIAACVVRLQALPLDDTTLRSLDTFQRYAGGHSTLDELCARGSDMHAEAVIGQRRAADYLVFSACDSPLAAGSACWGIAGAIAWTVAKDSIAITCAGATENDWFEWAFSGGPPDPLFQATEKDESRKQADLLREIMGNPFRAIDFDTSWLTPLVASIAQSVYHDQLLPTGELDPHKLAVLADALEVVNCTSAQILTHLRGPGPHVRGCWVVDLLLGKDDTRPT